MLTIALFLDWHIVSVRYLSFKKEVIMLIALMALLVSGSGISPPDVKDFTPVLSKELEFRINDYQTAIVGRIVVYQNPNDQNEFVRVYYRQLAIVSERAQERSSLEAGNRDADLSNLKYHSKEEAEALDRVHKSSDAFAYVKWRIVRDPRTGRDIRDSSFRSWLLEQNGNWTFSNSHNLATSPLSELSKGNPKKRIIVGIKFSLVGGTHIVRIDQDDILIKAKETTREKK